MTAIALCYNHERFVRDCLEGIRAQSYQKFELIIADDRSSDGSVEVIQRWIANNSHVDVTFIRHHENRGLCRTLNEALRLARGDYISMIATDDIWEPDKLARQVAEMERLPSDVGVVYTDASMIDVDGRFLPKRFIETYRDIEHPPEGNLYEILWSGNFIPGMTTLIRRSVFEKVGFYDEELFYEDWEMWIRMSSRFNFRFLPVPLARYRVVPTSMSRTANDRMDLANELIFLKYLLRGAVPAIVRGKAFNYAVRHIYSKRDSDPVKSGELIARLVSMYNSPRLYYAWLLFKIGAPYSWYGGAIAFAKRMLFR